MGKNNKRLQAARLRAISEAPYLATAIWSMHAIEKEGLGTLAVDKFWRLYYDPEILDEWSPETAGHVVIHEVWHLLKQHPERAELYDIKTMGTKAQFWNIAADCEINHNMKKEWKDNLSLPEGCCFPENYDLPPDLLTEEYYDLLKKKAKCAACGGKVDIDEPQKGHEDCYQKAPANGPGGKDGSGATGVAGDWEEGQGATDEDGDPIPAMDGGDGELIRRQVAHDIQRKHKGNVPGFAERWANDYLNPKVDWRKHLTGAIRGSLAWAAGMHDYTYSRPSRRQSAFPRIVFPSMRSPIPSVEICIDTSGSMSQDDLSMALGEIKGILESVRADVTVFAVDHHVHTKQKVYRSDEIELIGGGGTSMALGLEAMNEDRPDIGIVLTDGYTDWNERKPQHIGKVIICIIKQSGMDGGPPTPPSWATTVYVNPE